MTEKAEIPYVEKDGILHPNIQISNNPEADMKPLGKYGQMALNHLKETYPIRFSKLLTEGELMPMMHKVNEEAYQMLETLSEQRLTKDPVPNPQDTFEGYRHRQMIKDTAEEIVLREIVFKRR